MNLHDEQRAGELILEPDAAGLEIRRLARVHRIRPDCDRGPELLDRLDDAMLRMRYVSKRGIGVDDFAELLEGVVTAGRASLDRTVELLDWALRGRRMRRDERLAKAAQQLETRNVAREIVEQQQQLVTEFHNRTKRGTKLTAWVCECSAAIWASFRVDVQATCRVCGEEYRRKHEIPTLDEAAIVAASEVNPF